MKAGIVEPVDVAVVRQRLGEDVSHGNEYIRNDIRIV
jgi:hypothetical protein